MSSAAAPSEYGEPVYVGAGQAEFKPLRLLISWLLTGVALLVAAAHPARRQHGRTLRRPPDGSRRRDPERAPAADSRGACGCRS